MNYAVILSGGIGTRMHMGDFPKQYYKVKGRMILEYTLDSFEKAQAVDEIVIVMAPQWQEELGEELRGKYKKLAGFALPGEIRQESILSEHEDLHDPGRPDEFQDHAPGGPAAVQNDSGRLREQYTLRFFFCYNVL